MTVQEKLYSELRKAGMTHSGACAVLANVQYESAFIPNNVEDSSGWSDTAYTAAVDNGSYTKAQFSNDAIGHGLAQWTHYSRKPLLYDFWKQSGAKSIGDTNMQIAFLIWEMKNYFGNQWSLCCSSDDLYRCTWELLDKWENPAEKQNNMARRYEAAQNFSRQFQDFQPYQEPVKPGINPVEKVLNLAREEVGYCEKISNSQLDDKTANAGPGNWTKYARDLDNLGNFYNGPKNGFAWCDIFYDWLFVHCFGEETGRLMLCQPYNSAGAGCLYSAQYYKQQGRWHTDPEPGDQIFFSYSPGEYSHTGIVESVNGGVVNTIEGNSSDRVCQKSYSLSSSSIVGYGRPNWSLAGGGGDVPTPIPSPTPGRILKLGTRGEDVRELQEKLQKLGYDLGRWGADGDFGADTEKAVKKFQEDHSLLCDGEVGPDTWAAIRKALETPDADEKQNQNESELPVNEDLIPDIGVRAIRNGDKGAMVKLAQSCLSCLGFSVSIDGIFGRELEKKIREFQENRNLETDGVIGEDTWAWLLDIPFLK